MPCPTHIRRSPLRWSSHASHQTKALPITNSDTLKKSPIKYTIMNYYMRHTERLPKKTFSSGPGYSIAVTKTITLPFTPSTWETSTSLTIYSPTYSKTPPTLGSSTSTQSGNNSPRPWLLEPYTSRTASNRKTLIAMETDNLLEPSALLLSLRLTKNSKS